jgi:predicted dienelactone hydrolase
MRQWFLLSALLLGACGSRNDSGTITPMPTLKAGNYSADVGPSPVGVIPTALLRDQERNKDVDISIEYPTRGGPFPILVFSHGYGSSNSGYEGLVSYWTSYGYVCIRPAHADAGAIRDSLRDTMMEPPARRGQTQPGAAAPQRPQRPSIEAIWDREREAQWRDRVRDVRLVLDSLDELERRFPELQGKMDHARIGVAGHSYGAFTTMLIDGTRTFGNPPLALADPRVRAAVVMSPQGTAANRGLTPQSWAEVRIPVLYMTGTQDRGATEEETPLWRKQAYDYSPPGDKYFVMIQGARHLSFTGSFSPIQDNRDVPITTTTTDQYGRPVIVEVPQQRVQATFFSERHIFQIVKVTSLAFWDAYLKNDAAAREMIQPQKLQATVGGLEANAK